MEHAAGKQVQTHLNDYWTTYAEEYDAHQANRLSRGGEAEAWRRVWANALPDNPSQVLDIGTGSGHAAFSIASLGHKVTGIDLAEGMLQVAQKKKEIIPSSAGKQQVEFMVGDAVAPPFPEHSFDAIVGRYVLWTVRNPKDAIKEWRRVLRPGGKLILVDGLWFPEGLLSSLHASAMTERTRHFRTAYEGALDLLPFAENDTIMPFAEEIEAAGFQDVTVDELPEIYELDSAHGTAPNHDVRMNYRISATAPANGK